MPQLDRKSICVLAGLTAASWSGLVVRAAADELVRPVTPGFQTPFWQNARIAPEPETATRQETINALVQQTPILLRLRDWRETMRGSGASPLREFQLGSYNDTTLKFQLGKQSLPISELAGLSGTTSAMGLSMGRIAIGTTAPMDDINRALYAYDANIDGATQKSLDKSQMTWVTGRPIQTKSGSIDLLYARGRRDLTPTQETGKRFAESSLWGGRGEFALPAQWKLRGEWMNAKADEQDSGASAWKLGAGGPLSHPWGQARVEASYSVIDRGFAPHTAVQAANGQSGGEVAVTQDLKVGDFSGSARIAYNQIDQPTIAATDPVPETSIPIQRSDTTSAAANLRWQLAPSVALKTEHRLSLLDQRMLPGSTEATDPQLNRQNVHDYGVEVKLSSNLALTASASDTDSNDYIQRSGENALFAAALRDEQRKSIGLKHRTSRGSWGVQLSQRDYDETLQESDTSEKSFRDIRLEAERQVLSWLRLKGSMVLGDENTPTQHLLCDNAQRGIEAQFSLSSMGQLALRYNDWAQYQNGATSGSTSIGGAREYGVRYQVGATGSQGGLGLSVEYAMRNERIGTDTNNWRIGLTYK